MSDSGIPQPPPAGPKTVLSVLPAGKEDGQPARIEKVSGALEIVRKPTRVEGEIVRAGRDGTIRIRTPQGDMDVRVRVREGQPLPREGAWVEVDIAPGRPPRQALVRPASQETSPTPPRDASFGDTSAGRPSLAQQDMASGNPPPATDKLPAVVSRPPVLPTPFPADAVHPADPAAIPVMLDVGDYVRMVPLPPQLAELIVFPEPQDIPSVPLARAQLAPFIEAEKIISEEGEELLRLMPQAQSVPMPSDPFVSPLKKAIQQPPEMLHESLPSSVGPVTPEIFAQLPAFLTVPLPQRPVSTVVPPDRVLPPPALLILTGIRESAPQQQPPVSQYVSQVLSPGLSPSVTAIAFSSPPPSLYTPALILQTAAASWTLSSVDIPARAPLPYTPYADAAPVLPKVSSPTSLPAAALIFSLVSVVPPDDAESPLLSTSTTPHASLLYHQSVKLPLLDLTAAIKDPGNFLQFPLKSSAQTTTFPASALPVHSFDVLLTAAPVTAVRFVPAETVSSGMTPTGKAEIPETFPFFMEHLNPLFVSAPSTAPVTADIPAGKTASENLSTIIPSKAVATAMGIQKSPAALLGTVIGRTPQNLPVVTVQPPGALAPQKFILQANAVNLTEGSLVEFIPQPGADGVFYHAPFRSRAAGENMPVLPLPAVWAQLFGDSAWPAMAELQQVLQQQDGGRASDVWTRTVSNPASPARMVAGALFFLAAVRAGDVAGWLGEKTIDLLRRAGRADTVARLGRDFAGIQRTASEPGGGGAADWRGVALPMFAHPDIEKIMLYYRRDRNERDQEDSEEGGTRFVFDLHLSGMGAVQLDGFHRPVRQQLDLIVRTTSPVGGGMQQAMQEVWINALGQANLAGELYFQSKDHQFVKIPLPDHRPGLTI